MDRPGTLYIVATPIGNLEDITLRALRVLRETSLVACEDTRRTRRLLDRHGITARCLSYHKFNEQRAAERILAHLRDGRDVALVSDSGTPVVSDPGTLLVSRAVASGFPVRPVPGPDAAVAALSASGLDTREFTFRGFLPHRRGARRRALQEIGAARPAQIFFESPMRIAETLADMAELLGERRCCVVREMTKRYEQWHRGTLPAVAMDVKGGKRRGEFCVIVEGTPAASRRHHGLRAETAPSDQRPTAPLLPSYRALIAEGLDRRRAIKRLARESGLPRSEVYRRLVMERPTDNED
jgi:16S rRNA (cytidine1402-2'-O)-methyltransferase